MMTYFTDARIYEPVCIDELTYVNVIPGLNNYKGQLNLSIVVSGKTHQAITWANVDSDLCRLLSSLDHSELIWWCIKFRRD